MEVGSRTRRRVARSGEGGKRKCERLIDDRERLAIASPPRMEDKFIRCQWNAAEASRKKSTQHDAPPSASQSRFRCKFNRDDSRRSAVISRNYGDRVLNRRFVERSRSRSPPPWSPRRPTWSPDESRGARDFVVSFSSRDLTFSRVRT